MLSQTSIKKSSANIVCKAKKRMINSECFNDSSTNSFLEEVIMNSDISETMREEIEKRFLDSNTNAYYKFPRIGCIKKTIKSKMCSKKKEILTARNRTKFTCKKKATPQEKFKSLTNLFKIFPNTLSSKHIQSKSSPKLPKKEKKRPKSAREHQHKK